MATAQPGIFAQGTRSHYQLELVRRPGAGRDEIVDALRGLRESPVTAGGVNLVVAFGPDLWRDLAGPDAVPTDLAAFTAIDGLEGHHAPATQRDLWVWMHGTGEDIALDTARAVAAALTPVAEVVLEQACFVYKDSRDLTGFVDGTANPKAEEAHDVACVPDGLPGAGGSHVITQRWIHDLGAFHALPVEQQQAVIGRTKPDSIELEGDAKPPTAHIARVELHDDEGEEIPIYRRSTPYGTVGEHGLYFLGFSAERARFDLMLSRMFGVGPGADGRRDHLLDFTVPVTGSYFFAPSLDALNDLIGPPDDGS